MSTQASPPPCSLILEKCVQGSVHIGMALWRCGNPRRGCLYPVVLSNCPTEANAKSVAEELTIRRKPLYEWRAAYRKLGAAGLNRKRGRKRGGARASPDAAPATPAPLSDLAWAQARIAVIP